MTAKSAPQLTQAQQVHSVLSVVGVSLVLFAVAVALWNGVTALAKQQRGVLSAAATPKPVRITAEAGAALPDAADKAMTKSPENSRIRVLADFLAKRYKVSQAVTLDLVTIAHTAGQQLGLDPLLIIAVMAIESRFNPIAESVAGAKGLMQVIPKYHVDKFQKYGGEQYAVFDPETNIRVGAQILKDYLARTGHLDSALQMYAGALDDQEDTYTGKVMSEKERLQQALRMLRKAPNRRPDVEASREERITLADGAA
jgi:hypothetical protein